MCGRGGDIGFGTPRIKPTKINIFTAVNSNIYVKLSILNIFLFKFSGDIENI